MEQSNNTQKPQLTRNSSFAVLSLDHLQKILSTRSFHRITEDHAIKLNELFQQEVGRASHITAPPKFKENLIQESKAGALRYGVLVLKQVATPENFHSKHLMCLLKAVGNYPILREIDASGFKSFCSDKTAMIVLSCIRKQVKRYTPMLLPEERRAIMRKAKTRKSNEVDREVEALAKKEGVTKDDVARAPTKLNLKDSRGDSLSSSSDSKFTESSDAKLLKHKCWTLGHDGIPLFILQKFKFDDVHLQHEELRQKQKKKTLASKIAPTRLTKSNSVKQMNLFNEYNAKIHEICTEIAIGNEELEGIRRFREYDVDGSGSIEGSELGEALAQMGIQSNDNELQHIVEILDINQDGVIDEKEFVRLVSYKVQKHLTALKLREKIDSIMPSTKYLLHPKSNYMQTWDVMITIILIILAITVPIECAFLEPEYNGLFYMNRVIDVFLIKDIFMQFFIMYPKKGDSGDSWQTTWERDHTKIFKNYVLGWFIIDIVAVIPYDLIEVVQKEQIQLGATRSGGLDVAQLRTVKLVRLLRLAKLVRVLSHGRIISKLKETLGLRHSSEMILGLVVVILFVIHMIACMWMMTVSLKANGGELFETWYVQNGYGHSWPPDVNELYPICLYWSVQTITTIGYGDVANPGTTIERLIAVTAMISGSIIWAYLISMITTIIHFSQKAQLEHHQLMELLDQFSLEKQLSSNIKDKLKQYFVKRQSLDRMENYNELMSLCSPSLRGEVAKTLTGPWIMKISWLRNASETFVTSMALLLTGKISPPLEPISSRDLHVIVHGVAIKDMVVKCTGMVWGEDMVLHNQSLRRTSPAVTLTYCETLSLDRVKFERLLKMFPVQKKHVRRATIWMAFRRKFLMHAQEIELLSDQIQTMLKKELGATNRAQVRQLFSKYDKNGDGELDTHDFAQVLKLMGFKASTSVLENIMSRFDKDGDGTVSIQEFLDFFLSAEEDIAKNMQRNKTGMFKNLTRETNEIVALEDGKLQEAVEDEETYNVVETKQLSKGRSRSRLSSTDGLALKTEVSQLRSDISKVAQMMQLLLAKQDGMIKEKIMQIKG